MRETTNSKGLVKINLDPVNRIEGHMKIKVLVENGKVVDAYSCGHLFRGFEIILKGRDPRDAQHLTQRVCGVCPTAHAMASARCLDDAFGAVVPPNGRIIRNLIQGANYIQSHILHFYHLAALDYVRGPETAPFIPRTGDDYRLPDAVNDMAVQHYVQALAIRRRAHEMLAIFGAKMPHITTIMPGGVTEKVTPEKVNQFRAILQELTDFIDNVYVPDVFMIAEAYKDYFAIGQGCKNMLAFGVFPLDDDRDPNGQNMMIKRGAYTRGRFTGVDPKKLTEDVKHSWFKDETSGLHPAEGRTEPEPGKPDAYSWIKAPRYDGLPHEVGPLARMWVNKVPEVVNLGEKAFSVMGRHAARAIECKLIAHAMFAWLDQLKPGEPTHMPCSVPQEARGMGLWEAPRGALSHFIEIKDYRIQNYQIVSSTSWNGSPRDDRGQRGPIEEALVGTPVKDPENPIEVVRVVRSFDPCLACAAHLVEVASDRCHTIQVVT
ncbi:hydrogenase large subunit [Thermodesulfitimonas autotrophica]|uniref:Hydrogenase large subunit n=1 Tax=Thermodesulfitimonas autotrophica TaxID=1894989 RepID=A0A3N5BI21_9THEO|nr:nickel-dependent hydrogenase large subunit [Thermodesulfitimonas autotrophica]RPF49318.1 hydrogenase large subunit [Thermodesulfitimonas autotrophica]